MSHLIALHQGILETDRLSIIENEIHLIKQEIWVIKIYLWILAGAYFMISVVFILSYNNTSFLLDDFAYLWTNSDTFWLFHS